MQISQHLPRLRHQLGRKLQLGNRAYRVRGYIGNRQAVGLAHEAHLIPVIRTALAKREGTFVDVGVNTGQTLLKVLSIDPQRGYLGFEPQVACCACLGQFLHDNDLGHFRILPIALSDRDGFEWLQARDGYDEMASTSTKSFERAIPVPVRTGDSVLGELGVNAPAVIKIDVEGSELDVLRGLEATLAQARPVVIFEVLPNFTGPDRTPIAHAQAEQNSLRAALIWDLFFELGYRVSQISGTGECSEINAFDLDDREEFVGRDFVAWPESFADLRGADHN